MKKISIVFVLFFLFSLEAFSQVVEEEPDVEVVSEVENVEQSEVLNPYVEVVDDGTISPDRVDSTPDAVDSPFAEIESDSVSLDEDEYIENVVDNKYEEDIAKKDIDESITTNDENDDSEYKGVYSNIDDIVVKIPEARRPLSADKDKLDAAQKKDEANSDFKEKQETIKYGTPSEINAVVDKIVEEDDPRYIDLLYDLFQVTGSNIVKGRILDYFAKSEDPCLCDYAVTILDDPFDTSNELVSKVMNYVTKVKCVEAAPALVKLLEGEEEAYFNGALSALGKTGGAEEAKYLAMYLQRDDLETPQRQALMRTLGQMNAVETWKQVVEIAQDEDENSFVRMYAAESIGNMKKEESIPILINLFENGDPNMREYCIKGLSNFPKSDKAKNIILQAIRDEHVKVRLQAIKVCKENDFKDAVEYLIYRAKNDNENSVKKETYPTIASLNTKEGNNFLIDRITDKKAPDSAKLMASEALLKNGELGLDEIIELAKSVVEDDRCKPLRKGLGKLLAKYPKDKFGEICSMYTASKDAETAGLGLDMYKSGRYKDAEDAVRSLALSKTGNLANRNRAKKLLGIDDSTKDEPKKEPNKDDDVVIKEWNPDNTSEIK